MVLEGKSEGKRLLGRNVRSGDRNSEMDLREIEWKEWTGLIWLGIGKTSRLYFDANNISYP
jgi:hypothetical protein